MQSKVSCIVMQKLKGKESPAGNWWVNGNLKSIMSFLTPFYNIKNMRNFQPRYIHYQFSSIRFCSIGEMKNNLNLTWIDHFNPINYDKYCAIHPIRLKNNTCSKKNMSWKYNESKRDLWKRGALDIRRIYCLPSHSITVWLRYH